MQSLPGGKVQTDAYKSAANYTATKEVIDEVGWSRVPRLGKSGRV